MTRLNSVMKKGYQAKNKAAPKAVTPATINIPAIATALRAKPDWMEAMKILASRRRINDESNFYRMQRTFREAPGAARWSFEDLADFFKMLQDAGAGELQLEESSNPKFCWAMRFDELASSVLSASNGKGAALNASMDRPAPLPKLLTPTAPVIATEAPRASNGILGGETIVVQMRGIEFELDLSKVPPESLKVRRVL